MLLNDNLKSLGGGAKAAAREAIMDRYSSILPSLSKGYTTLPAKKAGIQRFVFWERQWSWIFDFLFTTDTYEN